MAEDKTKRTGRFAYLEDYRQGPDGSYIYTGTVHVLECTTQERRRLLLRLWLCGAAMLAATIAGGCIPTEGMIHGTYVILPYTVQLAGVSLVLWALGGFTGGGREIRHHDFVKSVGKIPDRAMITAVAALAACVAEILYLLLNGTETRPIYAAACCALNLLCFALALWMRRCMALLRWTERK